MVSSSEGWRGSGLLQREVRLWWHMSIATRGALCHQDFLRDPIHFQVMEGEPGVTYNHCLLSEVCNHKMCPFGVTSKVEGDMDFFCDWSILIWGAIDIVHEDGLVKWR